MCFALIGKLNFSTYPKSIQPMKKSLHCSLKTLLLLPILAAHFSLAHAQEEGTTVEDRVNSLEQKMDRILNLLESKASPPAAETPATTSAPTASPDQPTLQPVTPAAPEPARETLKEGTILEVWLLDDSFQGTTPPPTRSTGTLIDLAEPFATNNFLAESALDSIKHQRLAMRWSGFIVIREPGEYNFSIEAIAEKHIASYHTRSTALINILFQISGEEKVVFSQEFRDGFRLTYTEKQPSILEKGIYPFSFSFVPSSIDGNYWNYDVLKFQIKVRGPSDLTPRTMTIKDFVHKN
jgi:hypothetical protein